MTTATETLPNPSHAERAHARYAPSATDRWIECPASVPMSDGMPDNASDYAKEGESAHELGETILTNPGYVIPVTVPMDMSHAVGKYIDYINTHIRAKQPFFEHIEKRFKHPTIPDFFGTSDYCAAYMEADDYVLHFVDYKHGAGVAVDATENKQLLSYCLLIVDSFGFPMFTKFRATVVQPRCPDHDPISTWEFTEERLNLHRQQVLAAMQSTAIKAGPHCRWCPAAIKCPKLREHTLAVAQAEFPAFVEDKDVADWLAIFDMRESIKNLLDQLEVKLIAAAMRGVELPGKKVVESKSHRRWLFDEAKTLKVLSKHGIGKKLATETSLKSPAQMEKVEGVTKEMIAPMVHQEVIGHRIVDASARGKAVVFSANAAAEFDAVPLKSSELPPQPGDNTVLEGGVTVGEIFGREKLPEGTQWVDV